MTTQMSISLLLLLIIGAVCIIAAPCPDNWRLDVDPSKCVFVMASNMDFFDAESACQAFDARAHLVSIHSAFENLFIRSYVQEVQPNAIIYIGLVDVNQNGRYAWTDQSAFNYRNWKTGFPTNAIDSNCAIINVLDGTTWTNTDCTNQLSFVCQLPANQTSSSSSSSAATGTTTRTTALPSTTTPLPNAGDCLELFQAGVTANGIYNIYQGGQQYIVYCDMTTSGGGWTIIQRRTSGQTSFFNRTDNEYTQAGFGDVGTDHWQPLALIAMLSNAANGNVTWRFEISGNRCTPTQCPLQLNFNGSQEYIMSIGAGPSYTLTIPDQQSLGNMYPSDQTALLTGSSFADANAYCQASTRNCGRFWPGQWHPNGNYNQNVNGDGSEGLSYQLQSTSISGWVYPAMTAIKLRRNR